MQCLSELCPESFWWFSQNTSNQVERVQYIIALKTCQQEEEWLAAQWVLLTEHFTREAILYWINLSLHCPVTFSQLESKEIDFTIRSQILGFNPNRGSVKKLNPHFWISLSWTSVVITSFWSGTNFTVISADLARYLQTCVWKCCRIMYFQLHWDLAS